MIALQSDVRVYLACGYTDMRKGMQGLAMLVQQVLAAYSGASRPGIPISCRPLIPR
jgi:transposase